MYVAEFVARNTLPAPVAAVLGACGIGRAEELHSLLVAFPSLQRAGVATSRLAAEALKDAGESYRIGAVTRGVPRLVRFGCGRPARARWEAGSAVPIPEATRAAPGAWSGAPLAPVLADTARWGAARDQGLRATCVAHAVAALLEAPNAAADLSEQFLYWATKEFHDPQPEQDGTTLGWARAALATEGVCSEGDWGYNLFEVIGHKGDPPPPNAALVAAPAARRVLALSRSSSALAVHAALRNGPVALSVPVFASEAGSRVNNWTSPIGYLEGTVLDPPPTAVAVDGHCVCLVGFVPDATEPSGGWFVLRNSWGGAWGSTGSAANPRCPAPGYGSISASYVDAYTWEWATL